MCIGEKRNQKISPLPDSETFSQILSIQTFEFQYECQRNLHKAKGKHTKNEGGTLQQPKFSAKLRS